MNCCIVVSVFILSASQVQTLGIGSIKINQILLIVHMFLWFIGVDPTSVRSLFSKRFNLNKCKKLHPILESSLYFVISSSQRPSSNLGLNRPFPSILLYISVFIKDLGKEDNLFFARIKSLVRRFTVRKSPLKKVFGAAPVVYARRLRVHALLKKNDLAYIVLKIILCFISISSRSACFLVTCPPGEWSSDRFDDLFLHERGVF